ncbi:hypothetical protein, conserved [Eimeria maxima]|uniref:POPDC1-3 domain-containing protein n=1 Tax=Eimeria maxima TaxID=5804 RepID=U6M6Q0_EIMMA|nr:hypothetical protein, conserved [Eimeria maxima]CDJ58119.1 hypothetical protein, conserved [Eimeria maxima]
MHAFRLVQEGAPKTAVTTLPIVQRAYPVYILGANSGKSGPLGVRRWAANLDQLSAQTLQRQHLHRHQRQCFQQRPPHVLVHIKCFHRSADDSCVEVSAEPARNPKDLVNSGALPSPCQSPVRRSEYNVDKPVYAERASSDTGSTAHASNPSPAGSLKTSPVEAMRETPQTVGRRRRCIRVACNAGEASSSSDPLADVRTGGVGQGGERGVGQVRAGNTIVGRRRGRAVRICLKAAAAWLGAVLPQVSSADASRNSTVAAAAMLARGGRMGRSALPYGAASASGAAQQGSGSWHGSYTSSQTEKPEPSQPVGAEAADGVAPGDKVSATQPAAVPDIEAVNTRQCAVDNPLIGRRKRQRSSLGPLGHPGAPDVTSGGAMDFQFPILFNKAIKRLLKPLFRRTWQPRRQTCGRTTSTSTPSPAAVAAAGGARNIQRLRLPPRVLLRSWRPLSKAQSVGGQRQVMHGRQQQPQTLQRHLLQESSIVGEQKRVAVATQQLKQQNEQQQQQQQQQKEDKHGASPVAQLTATQGRGNVLVSRATYEGAVPVDFAANETAARAGSSTREGLEGSDGRQDWDGPRDALPNSADAFASAVSQEHKDEEKQLLKHPKEEQFHGETMARPPAAETQAPLKKSVGRGASRAGSMRRPRPVCFVQQRVGALYGQLRSLLAPYCSTVSEWTYSNGNVVVTVGSLLSLTATLMADMRLLRVFNLLAGFCYFSYNWSRRPRLTDAALWNVVFLVLNTVMLWRVHTEHREVSFSSDELDIFQRYFLPAGMSPRQFRRLLRQGSWRTFPQGYVLQQEDSNCETLCFVARGAVEISQGGEIVDTYRGGETGAVLGVEPFLSYVADLRRMSAKRVKHTAAGSPETLASHADEPPEGLQRHQQTEPAFTARNKFEQAACPNHKEPQSGTNKGAERTNNPQMMENTDGGTASRAAAVTVAGHDADTSRQQKQLPRQSLSQNSQSPLDFPQPGRATKAPSVATAGSKATPDAGGETQAGSSIVAAAAEAAATAAAAVRTAAATALLTEPTHTPDTQLPARAPSKASTATSLVHGGVSSAAEGARHVAEAAAAAAAAAVAAAADAASLTETSQNRRGSTERGLQRQQPARERSPSSKGESDDADGHRGEGALKAPATATCMTETTVFCLDLKELAAFVLREPGNLGFPVVQGLTSLLVDRSRAQAARLAILSYDAFLAGVFADGVVQTGERKMLEEFRRKRAISQAQHEQALARLGWTPEEFERGSQASTGVLSRMAFGLGSFLRGSPGSHGADECSVQQPHQANTSDRPIKDGDASHRVLPPPFEDWELVEDERAVPPQPAPGGRRSATGVTSTVEAHSGKECFGDAVSYALEAETISFH